MYSGLNHLHRNTQRRHYGGTAATATETRTKQSEMAVDDNVKPNITEGGNIIYYPFTAEKVPGFNEKNEKGGLEYQLRLHCIVNNELNKLISRTPTVHFYLRKKGKGIKQTYTDGDQFAIKTTKFNATWSNTIDSSNIELNSDNVLTITTGKRHQTVPDKDFKNGIYSGTIVSKRPGGDWYSLEKGDRGWIKFQGGKASDSKNLDTVRDEKCENENKGKNEGKKEDEKKGKSNMALYLVLAAIVLLAIYFLVIKKPARRQRGGKRRNRRRRRSRK